MMKSLLDQMYSLNLLGMNSNLPPQYQKVYETYAGSVARGVGAPGSDVDVVAVYVPDYEQLYPYKVPGFGKQPDRFKALQVPDLSVRVRGAGSVTVDVLALDIIHYFNMLQRGSPNHVEYLFFDNKARSMTPAGEVMLAYRDLFVTQKLLSKLVAAGCSMHRKSKTKKQYMLAIRFFAYAVHAQEHLTIDPASLRKLNKRVLSRNIDLSYAQKLAVVFEEHAKEAEMKATYLAPEADEELVNEVLAVVLHTHWETQSNG